MRTDFRRWLSAGVAATGLAISLPAIAADAAAPAADAAAGITNTNGDDIVVSATKVNAQTPITASIKTTEPQAIVSRSIIENSVSPTADYSQVILLTPGASLVPSSGNGVGLGDTKITLRGFTDGHYNITYDGIPFEDSNDPTHHSTSYFPDGTYERIIVDRGPGNATDLGQASYGGNIHIVSRELSEKFFVDAQSVYGSWNTYLERLTVNSGSIAKLDGLKVIAVGEYKRTDGALTNQPGWWANGFVKVEKPLGENALFSVLGSYNQSLFNQSDAAGGTTHAQEKLYGKNFGGVSINNAASSLYPNARMDWNWQNKTTDFEMARLQWDMTPHLHLDNKFYTFFYKNFTVSTEDSTTQCDKLSTVNECLSNETMGALVYGMGSGLGGSQTAAELKAGTHLVSGDIAGYTKVNQYRDWGDVLQLDWTNPLGVLKVGAWFEHSASHRYRYEYDFTKGSQAGGIGQYHFDFSIMNNGSNWNYLKSDKAYNTQLNGSYVPAYVNYDEHTSWDQIQGFGEFDIKAFNDKLSITPGVKVTDFTRYIDTPIAAQSNRAGEYTSQSYKPILPYGTIHYMVTPNLSTYAQFAKGFLMPSLSASLESKGGTITNAIVLTDPAPTRTTNWQAGFVYAGQRLNIDADVYYIIASNSTYTDPTNSNNIVQNADPAHYKGVEGQVSYVLTHGLTAIANGTLMTSKDATTGLWLAGAPNYTALLGAVYNTGRFKLSYLHKFTGKQWTDVSAYTAYIKPYSYGILSGSVTLGRATVGVTVNNPWNDRAVTAQSSGKIGASTLYIWQAPASYQAQVKVRF